MVPLNGSLPGSFELLKEPLKTLRLHVPLEHILWPESAQKLAILRPRFVLYGYMEPRG